MRRRTLTGGFAHHRDPSAIALQILNAVFYGLDLQELQTFRERVNAITVDVQRVARATSIPIVSIVLVGDANAFAKQLPGVGFDQFERISVNELDLTSADLRRHARSTGPHRAHRLPGRASTSEPAREGGYRVTSTPDDVRALIEKVIAAKGSLNKLRSIRTVRAGDDHRPQRRPPAASTFPTTSIRCPGGLASTPVADRKLVQAFNAGQ